MKLAKEWLRDLSIVSPEPEILLERGRKGFLTAKVQNLYLHSRYDPNEEAQRLIDSAALDNYRPVLVIGLGLGYHVLELLQRGFRVAVVEPSPFLAKVALESTLKDADFELGLGDAESIGSSLLFQRFVSEIPQVFIHPPTERLYPEFVAGIEKQVIVNGVAKARLSIAVIGPMYGGSLPIAGYLERAFRKLGHRTLYIDNSVAWKLHQALTASIVSRRAGKQLTDHLVHLLGEWNYVRIMEFAPDICIVVAQAPVPPVFPARLRQHGILSAFWFIENWRHLDYWQSIAPLYDFFFHIQPGIFEKRLEETGCLNHAFVQTACDPEIHRPVVLSEEERNQYTCDISFAGAGYPNRKHFFSGLTDYDFKIWGINWDVPELQNCVQKPQTWFDSDEFAKIVAGSKINLNLHSSTTCDGIDPEADAINPRVFEIAACGGFQLCDPCKGIENLFDSSTELPIYHNLRELREYIDYFLAHPQERTVFAERARNRVLKEHTYVHRAQQMLDLFIERHGKALLKKGIKIQRTVGEMINRVGKDSELAAYLKQLPQDLLFTYENIMQQLRSDNCQLSFSEAVFTYLRDLRTTAERLLEEPR